MSLPILTIWSHRPRRWQRPVWWKRGDKGVKKRNPLRFRALKLRKKNQANMLCICGDGEGDRWGMFTRMDCSVLIKPTVNEDWGTTRDHTLVINTILFNSDYHLQPRLIGLITSSGPFYVEWTCQYGQISGYRYVIKDKWASRHVTWVWHWCWFESKSYKLLCHSLHKSWQASVNQAVRRDRIWRPHAGKLISRFASSVTELVQERREIRAQTQAKRKPRNCDVRDR